jgi:nucleotide-binding universal stress UspA family protein
MKVLLATDGSEYADEAARFLAHLAHADKLDVSILTVINIPYVNSTRPAAEWRPECIARETEVAKQAYERVAQMFDGAFATVKHVSREGYLGETIIDEAKKSQAELIVMGARGRSTISRILLGSTSDYVATHAPCSVLVVRPTGIQTHEHQRLRVALAYDETGPSQAAIEEFSEFQWGPQTEMHVISAVSYVSEFLNEVVVEPNAVKGAAENAVRKAAEQLREAAPLVQSHLIESDHIGDGIVQFIEEKDCDLVVMGSASRSTFSQFVLGSISRYVLRHAPCSVWITRNRMIQGIKHDAGKDSAELV